MAKRGTLDHPKTLALASELGIDQPHAFGLLEALWHFAYQYAPAGDIGRYSDEVIVGGMRTSLHCRDVIDALERCGWIDRHAEHRLCIHDWADHADDATKKKLARLKKDIVATPERQCRATVAMPSLHNRDDGPPHAREPSHPIPSHSIPLHSEPREEPRTAQGDDSQSAPEGSRNLPPKDLIPSEPEPEPDPEPRTGGESFDEVAARIKAKAEAAEKGELAPDGQIKGRRSNGKPRGPVPIGEVLAEAAE